MNLIKYYHIGKVNFSNKFVYIIDTLAGTFFVGLIIFMFSQIWRVIYADQTTIAGLTINMMMWYFVMTESIVSCLPRTVEEVGEEIRSGEIANYLNKPYNYIIYHYSKTIGSSIFDFVLLFIVGGIIVALTTGGLSFNFIYLPMIILTILLDLYLLLF